MGISEKFQKRIQELSAETDINLSVLPKTMNVDYRAFSNAVNYGIIPSTRALIKIADFFNVSIFYLLGRTEQNDFEMAKQPTTFSVRIETLCKERELRYSEAAKYCHIDKSYISRWKSRKYIPTFEFVELLADYFEVSVDYLLGRTDNRDL